MNILFCERVNPYGIIYWVLEDPAEIAELVDVNLRRERESDDRARGRDPDESDRLRSLASRRWRLEAWKGSG